MLLTDVAGSLYWVAIGFQSRTNAALSVTA
jgi:hypothetical protein